MKNKMKNLVCQFNKLLLESNLVTWTSGNVSVADNEGYLYIKPSGILFPDLVPEDIAVVSINNGTHIDGKKPSTDTDSHRIIYKNKPEIKSVVHTHSTFATAFAACGRDIPVFLTAMADEFGELVKCSGYAEIGGEEIGYEVCKYVDSTGIVLLRNHGVFTVGKTVESAFKKAIMIEDIAKTTYYALTFGLPIELTKEQIKNCYDRYQNTYGQNTFSR